jgi:hypothetical protein
MSAFMGAQGTVASRVPPPGDARELDGRPMSLDEAGRERRGVGRTVVGCLLMLASGPVFLWLVPALHGLDVVVAGAGAIVAGVVLAGPWLSVYRRGDGSLKQQGCLALAVTLLALANVALILYRVVFYGAGSLMNGSNL